MITNKSVFIKMICKVSKAIVLLTMPVLIYGTAMAQVSKRDAGISGPGKAVTGSGWGGWRLAYDDYKAPDTTGNRRQHWSTIPPDKVSASVVRKGLLPPIKPVWDVHIRDAVFCVGGDGNYYMTGSTGDNIWDFNNGVELWQSKDLQKWDYMGVVWDIKKDGTWEKQPRDLHGKPTVTIWAPEIHYLKGNYFICLSMAPGGISILKSTTGKASGPYINTSATPDKPITGGIDPTFFQDDDGKVYYSYGSGGKIALMKDDMSGFAEDWHPIKLENPDHDSSHHAAKCMPRGSNDFGHEGVVLFKANGKYYMGAADDYEGRYSSCVAVADNIYGPYRNRQETVPCGGGTNFFKDKKGNWWCAFFGNDGQSPWREKPGIVKVEFEKDGKIKIAPNQPEFVVAKSK